MLSLNPFRLNRCDWFIALWVVYYLQGILYPTGSAISLGILGICLLISAICAVKVLGWNNNPVYFKGLSLLLLLFTLYGFYYILVNPSEIYYPTPDLRVKSYNYMKGIYLSMLPIYPFYYFSRKGYLTEKNLQRWGAIFLISVLLSFILYQKKMIEAYARYGSDIEEITNSAGYLFLSLIPLLVVYHKKPLLQFILLAFILAFIVIGMKRGAILIGAVVGVLFIIHSIRNSRGKTRFLISFFSLLICVGAVWFFIYQMNHSDYMMQRLETTMEGNSSGRDKLYPFFWKYFTEHADLMHYLFGRGANGTLELYINYAHNDWLEIAVNQGLVGVAVYAYYWVCLYKTWKHAANKEARMMLGLFIIIYFARTMFSMSYGDMSYVVTSVLGFALANVNAKRPSAVKRKLSVKVTKDRIWAN